MSELDPPTQTPPPPLPPENPLPPPPPPSQGGDTNAPVDGDRQSADTVVGVTIGNAEAKNVSVVGQYVKQYFAHGEGVHPFSIRHTVEVKIELETAIAEQFVHHDALIAAALADLESRRMLLLSGERN